MSYVSLDFLIYNSFFKCLSNTRSFVMMSICVSFVLNYIELNLSLLS